MSDAAMMIAEISTHAPLAGRDFLENLDFCAKIISTHAPLAGRDDITPWSNDKKGISTHAPLAGRDLNWVQ